jgi:hypothetical protein
MFKAYHALMQDPIQNNAAVLARELDWLDATIQARLASYFQQDAASDPALLEPPALGQETGAYAELVCMWNLSAAQRLVLVLALAPHLAPES